MQNAFTIPLLVLSFILCGLGFFTIPSAVAQPVTGLYVSGAGGASYNQDQSLKSKANFPTGRDHYDFGATGLGAIGWGLGNGFRIEVEGNYRENALSQFRSGYGSSTTSGRQTSYGGMANALFDMDVGANWVYPYFGAGIGYAWQNMNAQVALPAYNYRQKIGGTSGHFAYQAMFGLAFPVAFAPGLSLTTEYRFFTMLGPQSHSVAGNYAFTGASSGSGGTVYGTRESRTDFNHSFLLGLRYEFNAPPPPVVAPTIKPVADVAPAPAPTRNYLVFFDWDRVDLSERAKHIIAIAAENSTSIALTRIEVNGYTDNSAAYPGPRGQAYNLKLSQRRADVVKAELIRDGVPADVISTKGFGEADPMVVTRPNTRQPQNRRVEIILD